MQTYTERQHTTSADSATNPKQIMFCQKILTISPKLKVKISEKIRQYLIIYNVNHVNLTQHIKMYNATEICPN